MAGYKHHVSDAFTNYLKQETMPLCQRESFYQVDLLSPAKVRITDREYYNKVRLNFIKHLFVVIIIWKSIVGEKVILIYGAGGKTAKSYIMPCF